MELSHEEAADFFRDMVGPYARRIPFGLGRWLIGSVLGARDILDEPVAAAEHRPVFELRAA
jgi:hypothetical protein